MNKSVILFISLVLLYSASNTQWGKAYWSNIVKADGKGYYAYLPAIFIYNDLNFNFFDSIEKKYPNPNIFYDYRVGESSKRVNKYFVGTAIAIMPFFIAGHAVAIITGNDADGYSKPYLVCVSIAAICYLLLGLYFLKKLLLEFGNGELEISLILIALVFGTNVFYYVICEPAMSHIYSFAFVTMFVYFLRVYFLSFNVKSFLIISFLFGFIVLLRPVNALIVLIAPFLAGNGSVFVESFKFKTRHPFVIAIGLMVMLSFPFIQMIIYKLQTGYWWVDSYGNETFNWFDAHPVEFLLSFKKGLLVYTPLVAVSLVGLVYLFQTNKFRFFSFIFFLSSILYVLSSWWSWWYGGSFSSRVSIEYYFAMALLLGFALRLFKTKWKKSIYVSFIILTVLFCQLQTYQYRYYNIHWEKMDKEHYWRVFMRIDKVKENPNSDLLQ